MSDSKRTKLEKHLYGLPLRNRSCEHEDNPVLIMRATCYIGCPKCGHPYSRQVDHQTAQRIQAGHNAS